MDFLPIVPARRPVVGTAWVPGSKSITNRALALAALGEGTTRLTGALFADDTARMMDCLRALGFAVEVDAANETVTVEGQGGRIPNDRAELFVGNSGTTARFVTPLLALGRGEYTVDGVARMRERPMGDLLRALRQLDVDVESRGGNGCPPLRVRASGLRGGTCAVRGDTSSQFLSGLLLAAPVADGAETRIGVEGPLLSAPYVEMTVAMMRRFGVVVNDDNSRNTGLDVVDAAMLRMFGAAVEGDDARQTYVVPGRQTYRSPGLYAVEPDASAATYFWAAAAITGGRVRVNGIGRRSLQGDARFVDVLKAMGCTVTRGDDWTEVAGTGNLRGASFDMNAISDTVMTLAAVAPFADGPTTIENVGHIRHKETDRLRAVATELARLGVGVVEREDSLTITPIDKIKPATIQTYDDHRMAMAFALIGLRAEGIVIADPGCVAKTFPDYFARLTALVDNSAA